MLKLFIVYLSIWVVSLIGFWSFLSGIEPNSYIVLFFLISNPVVIIILSIISSVKVSTKRSFLFIVLLGFFYMLLGYLTFDLLNMIIYGQLVFPSIMTWVIGLMLALFGFSIGKIIKHFKKDI